MEILFSHLITVSTKKLSVILKPMKQIGKITAMLMLIILIILPTFRESAPYVFISTLKKFKTWYIFVHYSWNRSPTQVSEFPKLYILHVISLQLRCCKASHRLATPVSLISLPPKFSVVSLQLGCCKASDNIANPGISDLNVLHT